MREASLLFDTHYSGMYGNRWPSLKAALLQPRIYLARINRFAGVPGKIEDTIGASGQRVDLGYIGRNFPQPIDTSSGLKSHFLMDPASIFAVLALDVSSGDGVLDLCAAPGGKALMLAEALCKSGTLVLNELSSERLRRLRSVLRDYLPEEIFAIVRTTRKDASRWGLYEKNKYQRVLTDVPCSSERHVLNDPQELARWTPKRGSHLARRQYAILCAGLMACKPGGRIVYCTCSINPAENDGVVERLMTRHALDARVIYQHWSVGEATTHGWQIFPDLTGWGPIYVSVIEKS